MTIASQNPLSKHFRQPKLYIRLPSGGTYYPQGSYEQTDNQEIPVLAMTAKDELMFKTPDALLNGQATVNVIQSCFPNIKNAWNVPSIDVDVILLAMRIATYGEKMDITVKVPGLKDDNERVFTIDLRNLIDTIIVNSYDNVIEVDDFRFEIRPMSYKSFTEVALKSFEEQRLFRVVNDDKLSESEKLEKFNESFKRLTDLNVNQVIKSVVAVQYMDETPVTNPVHIAEFFENADKHIYKKVISHIDEQKKKFSVPPLKVTFSEVDQENGAPPEMEIPITFDQANFFA